jgi:Zn-dependent peptidase ImmA (M78 family)
MIERGKRVPSLDMLNVIAQVFQKDPAWFLDNQPEEIDIVPIKGNRGGISGMALEPSFLFSNQILQIAIPEMLSQTGISGRQFAHLLIRAHQESVQNNFPDLERAAEEIGEKRLNLAIEDLMAVAKRLGMDIRWVNQAPNDAIDELGVTAKQLMTSFFEPPNTIYLNERMRHYPTRLKYDLAVYIGHRILHNTEDYKTTLSIGHTNSWENLSTTQSLHELNSQDILQAWHDFESSFFAGALLCPKVPFRQLLDRNGYEIAVHKKVGVSPSVAMRRMTVVSPYPHWHYFDAYGEGKLKAIYRGNGIPLPWGNMRKIGDPCQHWAVFRQFASIQQESSAQISILQVGDEPRIYCCESLNVIDPAGNKRVLCAGIDLNPAIHAQGIDALDFAHQLKDKCIGQNGEAPIPDTMQKQLLAIGKVLNINWIQRGIDNPARLICARGSVCPRKPSCYQQCKMS